MKGVKLGGILLLIILFSAFHILGQGGVQPLQTIRLQPILSGLTSPVFLTSARDGSKRIFIVEQGGTIKVLQPGAATATDFLKRNSGFFLGLGYRRRY